MQPLKMKVNMTKDTQTEPVQIMMPKYERHDRDTALSFDRYAHREMLYAMDDYCADLAVANALLMQELRATMQRVTTLESQIKSVAQAGRKTPAKTKGDTNGSASND